MSEQGVDLVLDVRGVTCTRREDGGTRVVLTGIDPEDLVGQAPTILEALGEPTIEEGLGELVLGPARRQRGAVRASSTARRGLRGLPKASPLSPLVRRP